MGLKIDYSECYCCGCAVPRDLCTSDNLYCNKCAHIAWDRNEVEKERRWRFEEEAKRLKEAIRDDAYLHGCGTTSELHGYGYGYGADGYDSDY